LLLQFSSLLPSPWEPFRQSKQEVDAVLDFIAVRMADVSRTARTLSSPPQMPKLW
jgi:hypothetical protein